MSTHKGQVLKNAETIIDYKNKSVKFKYPENLSKESAARATPLTIIFLLFYIFLCMGFVMSVIFEGKTTESRITYRDTQTQQQITKTTYAGIIGYITYIGLMTLAFIASYYLAFKTADIIFKNKKLKDKYPKINAWLTTKRLKYKTILRHKYGPYHIIVKNKLFYLNYDITYFQYKYIGKNKIRKFETKYMCKHDKERGLEGKYYIAIFTFEKPVTEGILLTTK